MDIHSRKQRSCFGISSLKPGVDPAKAISILEQVDTRVADSLIGNYLRQVAEPVKHGDVVAAPGKVFNIQFDRPYRKSGCGGISAYLGSIGTSRGPIAD